MIDDNRDGAPDRAAAHSAEDPGQLPSGRRQRSSRHARTTTRSPPGRGDNSAANREPPMQVGFYGKLPSHGDFLRRRVSDAFVDAWDAWLRECLAASRDGARRALARRLPDEPGVAFRLCGGRLRSGAGDRAGRAERRPGRSLFPGDARLRAARARQPDHGRGVAAVLRQRRAPGHRDAGERARGLRSVRSRGRGARAGARGDDRGGRARRSTPPRRRFSPTCRRRGSCRSAPRRSVGAAFEQLLSLHLEVEVSAAGHVVDRWVRRSSSRVASSSRACRLRTSTRRFSEGSWAAHRWRSVPARASDEPTLPPTRDEACRAAVLPLGCCDGHGPGAAQQRRRVRRASGGRDLGGGRRHGRPQPRRGRQPDGVRRAWPTSRWTGRSKRPSRPPPGACRRSTTISLRTATSADPADRSGSTVVVLLLRGLSSAVLWAGDSRVYRWRAGKLEQLTRDHSLAELAGAAAAASSVITNAVGVEPDLTLDLHRDAHPRGRPVPALLRRADPGHSGRRRSAPGWRRRTSAHAVDGLIKATLDAGAPDNVTVLIAEAHR